MPISGQRVTSLHLPPDAIDDRLQQVRSAQGSRREPNPSDLAWAPVRGYPGFDVSTRGHVRSWWISNAPDEVSDQPRILRAFFDAQGYWRVSVHRIGTRADFNLRGGAPDEFVLVKQTAPIHRLLLPAFTRPAHPYERIYFLDDDITHVTLENLSWTKPTPTA